MKKLVVCILAAIPLLFVSCGDNKDIEGPQNNTSVQNPKDDVGTEEIWQVGGTRMFMKSSDYVVLIQDGSMNCMRPYASIASVGAVNSLNEVNYVPISGWNTNIDIKIGHGYVVKFEYSPYDFSRIRFLERIDKGGVVGYRVRAQDYWNPLYN